MSKDCKKKALQRYQNLSEEGQEKKICVYQRYKNLPEDEKQRLAK